MNTILNNLLHYTHRPFLSNRSRATQTGKTTIGHRVSMVNFLSRRMLLAGSLLASLAYPAQAQPEEISYLNTRCYDTKHYATSQENNGRDIAMSGTLFNYNGMIGNNAVHLLTNASPFGVSVVYDDRNYDERPVGVHYNGPNNIYIVSTALDYTGGAGTGNGVQLIEHPAGLRKFIFAPSGQDLWPLGSLMDPNQGIVWVCGYVTRSQGPGRYPNYNTAKQAFVLRWNVLKECADGFMTYDWPAANPSGNDYDMAHRMKFVRNGTQIWVGGSCNATSGPAMMNMVINPATLIGIDNPLVTPLMVDGQTIGTSFDIAERLNGTNYSYIFGNYFTPRGTAAGGMDPQPGNYNITTVNAGTYVPPVATGNSHAFFSGFRNAWGTNLVYGNRPNSVIMSGYQDVERCGSLFTGNYYPFLVEPTLNTTTAGNIVVGNLQWSTMLTAAGTNGFNTLGGGQSNLVHGPVTTVRDLVTGTNEITFNGPVTDRVTGCSNAPLGIKYIRTNSALDPFCKIESCTPRYDLFNTRVSNAARTNPISFGCKIYLQGPDPLDEKTPNCAIDGYYKPSGSTTIVGVEAANTSISATVFPNPAQDVIQVQLSGNIEESAGVKVLLSDITGKQLSVLYQGAASGLHTSLSLPNLPRGLYTVTVTYNDNRLKSIPLVIN